jgi:hypothetical protein
MWFAGGEKAAGMDFWRVAEDVEDVWLLDGQRSLLFERPDMANLPKGDLLKACAHWCGLEPET